MFSSFGERLLPCVGDTHRIGRDERQSRAARQRLAHPHPGVDPERLRRLGDLADMQLAAEFRRERRRLAEQAGAPAGSDGELETFEKDADDHNANRCSHLRASGRKLDRSAARS